VNLPAWKDYCATTTEETLSLCETGLSFANYALPTFGIEVGEIVPSNMTLDGRGQQVPLETGFRLMKQHNLIDFLLPLDWEESEPFQTNVLRTCFRFRFYCCNTLEGLAVERAEVTKAKALWREFTEQVLPILQAAEPGAGISVYYNGPGFSDIEVTETLMGDIYLATGSLVFVLFYLVLHTQSFLLGSMGLVIVVLAVPLAYVATAILSGSNKINIASCLSLFLIVGLGSDVIFVYSDFWKMSVHYRETHADRMAWTYWRAGKASLATTATTALSFFANLASVLRALRNFGLFMGLCVTFAWLLVSLIYMPLCVVEDRFCNCCHPFRNYTRRLAVQRQVSGQLDLHTRIANTWTWILYKARYWFAFVPPILTIIFVVAVLGNIKTDTGVPNVFPKDHNQNKGKEVLGLFVPTQEIAFADYAGPPQFAEVCQEHLFREVDPWACALFWCEASLPDSVDNVWEEEPANDGNCTCFRRERPWSPECSPSATDRFAGLKNISDEQLKGPILQKLITSNNLDASVAPGWPVLSQELAQLVLVQWETGDLQVDPLTEVTAQLQDSDASNCGWDGLCFCGVYHCKLPSGWRKLSDLDPRKAVAEAPAPDRELASAPLWSRSTWEPAQPALLAPVPRSLQELPSKDRTNVEVVFGINVKMDVPYLGEADGPGWSFLESFKAAEPWAQRNMYSLCVELPENLLVAQKLCWMDDFRTFALQRGYRFPVPIVHFDRLVNQFAGSALVGEESVSRFLWMRNDEVKACSMSFVANVRKTLPTADGLVYKQKWSEYMDAFNSEASPFAVGAFHTSELWVRVEAQSKLISSTAQTLLIVLFLAFLGMLGFTRDCVLSMFVVFNTVSVVCALAFFIVVVMGWPIGPIEVIALIVFIGYAVTYSLHIAHKYGAADDLQALGNDMRLPGMTDRSALRVARTLYSLKAMAGAALGSSITTVGCALFLVSCTLTIFEKLGAVVLVVTIMSIFAALGPLPAVLMLFGPVSPGCRRVKMSLKPHEVRDRVAAIGNSLALAAGAHGTAGGESPAGAKVGPSDHEAPVALEDHRAHRVTEGSCEGTVFDEGRQCSGGADDIGDGISHQWVPIEEEPDHRPSEAMAVPRRNMVEVNRELSIGTEASLAPIPETSHRGSPYSARREPYY